MTAALVAAVCMTWAWFLRARNLDRRDRARTVTDWGVIMHEYEARTTRPLKGYHLGKDRHVVIPGGALVTVVEGRTCDGQPAVTATAQRPDGPYGINLNPDRPAVKRIED